MARSIHLLLSGLVGASCLLAGCPEQAKKVTTPTAITQLPEPDLNTQRINGTIVGPAALGDGTRITGSEENDGAFGDIDLDPEATEEAEATEEETATEEAAASDATATDEAAASDAEASTGTYRLLQTPGVELPVENAFISIKSYQWKAVNQLLTKRSDEDGKFYFNYVPAKVAFFIEGIFTVGDKKYYMLGLTRTGDIGETTAVKIDVASTMVARLLLRVWHISNRFIDFKELSPKDYNPLVMNLRKELENGMPDGITIDLSKVSQPVGEFTYDANGLPSDKDDSALQALDKLSARNEMIDRDVDRIYRAINKNFSGREDGPLKRPPLLR